VTDRSASVLWDGPARQGRGMVSTETGALLDYPYGFASRFGSDHRGTNPEELLAAAHAACFTMAFSLACDKAGFATRTLDTQAHVQLSAQGDGFVIDRMALHLRAVVPGLDEPGFQAIAAAAKRDCPVSQALSGVAEISLVAVLDPPTPT
jgi:lipoyl-dependent peroxiredoxin